MPKEILSDPRKNFVPRFLPWLLAAAMFVVFALTLNPWMTMMNLVAVANISGWIWQPQLSGPFSWLITYPLRCLSPAHIPFALNLLAALFGAATLGLLARCVALLPHDRTETERQREHSDFSFLTGWMAWVPPIMAVVFAGLQLTFWENATNYTGETFQLLIFAVIVWLLLEYRLDEAEWRLFAATFIYGAGITENWALIGFFPIFLAALIWLKRMDFFNLRFLSRMLLLGWAGLLFFLLLPLGMKIFGNFPITFWQALQPALLGEWQQISLVANGGVRHNLALMALSTLVPVLVISFRWSASFGDNSKLGSALANYMIHFVHAVLFTVCVWVMFDPPFSPRLLSVAGSGLTFYFFTALSLGYFCGYFLLVFGRKALPTRRTAKPEPALPAFLSWLCPVVVAGTIIAGAFCAGTLVYRNHPIVKKFNDDTLFRYAQFSTQNLPKNGAILLCDSEDTTQDLPARAFLAEGMLAREGRAHDFPVVDTQSLNWAPYHRFLHAHFPKQWPDVIKKNNMGQVSQFGLLAMMSALSQSNNICYLNPSFGYYFEKFYQSPRGMVYSMIPLPEDLLPPPLQKNVIAENENFWDTVARTEFPKIQSALALQKELATSSHPEPKNLSQWLLMHLHSRSEPNPNALMAGTFYSRDLNFWGVQLQRAGDLDRAAVRFAQAKELNPDNVVAGINLDFNRVLHSGAATPVDLSRVNIDQFGKYRSWNALINANGPFDEPGFCFEAGAFLMQGGLMRQAAAQFDRVRQLAPDNLATRLFLAQVYVFARQPDRALEALRDPLTQPEKFLLNKTNSTELNILAASAYFQKNENDRGINLIETELNRHPDDDTLMTIATQAYFLRGLYTNALHVINRKLKQTPDAPQWLFGRGYANIQIGNYPAAITALTRALEIQTNDPIVRFNRALAYLDSTNLPAARADYLQLQTTYTNSFQVAFGLGEIAWRQHDTNEAIRNYQLYLATAPTNSAEAKTVRERLHSLKP